MLPFLHQRLQVLERLQADCSAVLAKYNRLDLDLWPTLTAFLDQAIASCQQLNRAGWENQFLALKAQCVSAAQGTHPDTLERITSHRRELQRAVALRVLQHSAALLRSEIERDQQALADANTQLRTMLLMAIQQQLVPMQPRKAVSQRQLDTLWRTLLKTPEMQLAARQLAMQVSVPDLQLLLGDLIHAARGTA